MSDHNLQYILVGYSGHAYVVAEAAILQGLHLVGYIDIEEKKKNPFKLEYLGTESTVNIRGEMRFILGIGDNNLRCKIASIIEDRCGVLGTVIHPSSSVSNFSEVDTGVFIARNASVNPLAKIHNNCIVNTGAVVEHECVIHNGAHIAPGAVLAGNVTIGENTFIGANSVIKQGVVVGENVVIGAGSVVVKDIISNQTLIGNPAKVHTK